ncbi:Aste57867_7784 [Aphanomyces stellatus]|uniref:Aste57867_7784 protein n=1 Tax=Aphanomyces stellatus TaxID=120398 RepID=A0A485KIS7_9STRA|nr:hypothetical protein As57867_007754 [Aphanomyces stellatus]VFT84683.1 Aste57867_7784 [Aphanomyces stellatus]
MGNKESKQLRAKGGPVRGLYGTREKTAGTQPSVPSNGRGRPYAPNRDVCSTRRADPIIHDVNWSEYAELDRYKNEYWLDPSDIVHSRTIPSNFFQSELGHYLGQPLYIKSVNLASKDLAWQKTTLVHEVHTLARVNHPNLVQFIGFCISEKHGLCCFSEYMEGRTLRHLLNSKRQSPSWPKEKIQIAMDIAAAIVYLHSLHPCIIFRNIKAAKVLLTSRQKAKLSVTGRDRSFEDTMPSERTIEWSAPELLLDGATCDERVDVYSFGVLLTELDTRELPFATEIASMLRSQITHLIVLGKLRPALSDTCPPCIKQIVDQCLQQDPLMRPSSQRVLHMLREARLELLESA